MPLNRMTAEEHRHYYIELYKALDELVDDYITHTGNMPSVTSIMVLMEWVHKQTYNPAGEYDEDQHS